MKKPGTKLYSFIVNVNGNQREVKIESISNGLAKDMLKRRIGYLPTIICTQIFSGWDEYNEYFGEWV